MCRKKIKPTIVTNGILLNARLLSFLQKYQCNLAISLDSLDKDIYLRTRGVDCLDKVLNNIQMASAYPIKGNKAITTTVNQLNHKEVLKIKDFSEKNGFMYAIRPYIYMERGVGRSSNELVYKNKDEIIDLFKKFVSLSKEDNFLASLVYERHVQYLQSKNIGRCDALTKSFHVQEDGSCSYCIEFPAKKFSMLHDIKRFNNDFKISCSKFNDEIIECSNNTPCFFNCARSVGIIWNSKGRILLNAPKIIKSMKKYGFFF